jgi:hypothetical protein
MAVNKSPGPSLPESPLVGSSYVGPGISGTAFGYVGVSGTSLARPLTAPPDIGVTLPVEGLAASDGVLGEGKNGVHGVSALDNGVLGENSATGYGVSGTSARGTGVHGVNGSGSGTAPKFGCGVFGESDNGYGVYGASKTASGVYGTSGPLHLAGEFVGNVGITGTLSVTSKATAFDIQHGAVFAQSSGAAPAIVAQSNGSGAGIIAIGSGQGDMIAVLGEPNLPGLAAFLAGDVFVTGTFANPDARFSNNITSNNVIANGNVKAKDVTLSGKLTAIDVILSGADCAEEFDIAKSCQLEPGTVVVFNDEGALSTSDKPYNNRVAGVVSGAGVYRPGVILDRRISDRKRAPVALVGKVYCKVDASYAPIEVGDFLTTSPTVGHAMKAMNPERAFGATIGKALAPFNEGTGLIPVLVTLG